MHGPTSRVRRNCVSKRRGNGSSASGDEPEKKKCETSANHPKEREREKMAEGLNCVHLLGNLGADPELRATPGGQSVCRLSVATTESYVDRNNQRQEKTEWHRCTIWGKRAEALAKLLRKGERVMVIGKLQTSSYEKNGEKRYSTEIVVTDVKLCGGAPRPQGSQSPMATPRPPTVAASPPFDDAPMPPPPMDGVVGGEADFPF